MEQRPLRLGDLVDDYCPRERRITNHAIVALVGEAIKQTRCTTCDAEHVYKGGHTPKRKKKNDTSELYQEVLSNAGGQLKVPEPAREEVAEEAMTEAAVPVDAQAGDLNGDGLNGNEPQDEPSTSSDETWSAHRPLIRATLPRNENDQPPPRPIPEFTMHQRGGHGHGFRQGHGWGNRPSGSNGNGFRAAGPGQGHGRRRRGRRRPK